MIVESSFLKCSALEKRHTKVSGFFKAFHWNQSGVKIASTSENDHFLTETPVHKGELK